MNVETRSTKRARYVVQSARASGGSTAGRKSKPCQCNSIQQVEEKADDDDDDDDAVQVFDQEGTTHDDDGEKKIVAKPIIRNASRSTIVSRI